MARVGKNLEYDGRAADWVDFQLKINYLYERLFEGDKKKLTEHLSDKSRLTEEYLKIRLKTIDSWLNGDNKKANNFDVSKFKIGDFRLNDKPLFTKRSFQFWSIDTFKKRVDSYLDNQEVYGHIQYIYFFDTKANEQKVSYFDVSFPNNTSDDTIQLHYANMLYTGTIERFNMVTYIYLKSDYDHMNFIFKISANTSKSLRVFGMANTIDDATGKPKAFHVLLTSYLLSKEEEEKYAHKLNFSNIMLADDFSNKCVLKESYFMENFTQKVATLGQDLQHYKIDKSFSEEIYLDTILKEYENYMKFLEKAHNHTKYFISSRKESQLFSMKGICKKKKITATISYFLNIENLFLLEDKNPIIENQITLIKENLLDLTYLFVVTDKTGLTSKVIQKIEYMEQQGISIKMSSSLEIDYSKSLLIKDSNFALFKFKSLVADSTLVTRHKKTIDKIFKEQESLKKESISFKEFMQKENPLCGVWHLYNYGSAMDKSNCHETILEIKNNRVKGNFYSGYKEGVLFKTTKQILLIFDTITIKISISSSMGQSLFRVSIISQDIDIRTADLLVFGIFSKESLKKEEIVPLLDTIYMKEEADYRLKVCDSFPRKLAEFKRSKNIYKRE
ncbi:MAG: hypothetical protein KAG56_08405 [Sulfurovaceae bacterium]|nr:hypothetical protein [Sulfurovaceae bacterium]